MHKWKCKCFKQRGLMWHKICAGTIPTLDASLRSSDLPWRPLETNRSLVQGKKRTGNSDLDVSGALASTPVLSWRTSRALQLTAPRLGGPVICSQVPQPTCFWKWVGGTNPQKSNISTLEVCFSVKKNSTSKSSMELEPVIHDLQILPI